MIKLNNNRYGAIELKMSYQRNIALAMALVIAFVGCIFISVLIYMALTRVDTVSIEVPPEKVITKVDLGIPPTVIKRKPLKRSLVENRKKKIGNIPKPIADDEFIDNEEMQLVTQDELAVYMDGQNSVDDLYGDNIVIDLQDDDPFLTTPSFSPFEIGAELIYAPKPDYPRQARLAGMEASVYIQMLVDENGNVINAVIGKESRSKAGFDEAALRAARKCKFKPAIQNGMPVKQWVGFTFDFELTN